MPAADPKSAAGAKTRPPVVLRISPMAHFAVGFATIGLLVPVLTWPVTAPILVIPIIVSVMIVRLRTVADADGMTVRDALSTRFIDWSDLDGLRFHRSSWARAHLKTGEELRLPAVTFSTLPLLSEASGGRVPNPYA